MTNIRNTNYITSIARAVFGPLEVITLKSLVDHTRGRHERRIWEKMAKREKWMFMIKYLLPWIDKIYEQKLKELYLIPEDCI